MWKGVIFGSFWVFLTQLGAWLAGRRLPYSWYYAIDGDRREQHLWRLRTTGLQSLADVRTWKEETQASEGPLFANPRARELCVGILSYSSGMERRLGETVGSLLARTQKLMEDRVQITIFNAKDSPSSHYEAMALKDLLNVENLQYPPDLPTPADLLGRPLKIKKMLDYATVLRMLEGKRCKRYVVLEDGAIAATDWAKKILQFAEDNSGKKIAVVRMMANLDEVRFSWRELGDFTLISALAAVMTIVVWVASAYLLGLFSHAWHQGVLYCSPLVVAVLFINFYVASLTLGKPNIPPIRAFDKLKPIDSRFLAVANFYPDEKSLTGYRSVLEEHLMGARHHNAYSTTDTFDRLYPRLVQKFARETGETYEVGISIPSLFQNTVGEDGDVAKIPMSFDFGQDQLPIRFSPHAFQGSS